MAEFKEYCGSDSEIHAEGRRATGFWTKNSALCNWSVCGAEDVRAWFAAANYYILKKFKPHFDDYKNQIQMRQGAPNADQIQIIKAADELLAEWDKYSYYYRRGGGGPVGTTFQPGGYSWEPPEDADPEGPGLKDFLSGDTVVGLIREIIDPYHEATCLRDRFNETRPEGMLKEVPEHGKVATRPDPEAADTMGMGTMFMMAAGGWLLFRALQD